MEEGSRGRQTHQSSDPDMTRFWLSPSQAVDYIIEALMLESGHIYIPKLPGLSIGKLAEYTVGNVEQETIPVRPGEKKEETLLTFEELDFVENMTGFYNLSPTTERRLMGEVIPYTSDEALQLTRDELTELLNG